MANATRYRRARTLFHPAAGEASVLMLFGQRVVETPMGFEPTAFQQMGVAAPAA
jgi:hypothetical protein